LDIAEGLKLQPRALFGSQKSMCSLQEEHVMDRIEREIEIIKISPNLRCIFDSETLDDLRRSILAHGQLEPVSLWFTGGMLCMLDGEKRWRIFRALGITRVRAVIQEGEEPGRIP